MSQIVAKLEITMTEDAVVSVKGTGALLRNRAILFGLLELAKEAMREQPSAIQPATLGDMPH